MLTESNIIDLITITENGHILVRTATVISRDGIEVSRTYHRASYYPGQDLAGVDSKVSDIAAAAWTSDVIAAYQASIAG